jgi:hypothetical protein
VARELASHASFEQICVTYGEVCRMCSSTHEEVYIMLPHTRICSLIACESPLTRHSSTFALPMRR